MDGLLAEISSKRKELGDVPDGGPKKYLKRAEVERLREEEERKAREKAQEEERKAREEKERGKAETKALKMRREAEKARLSSLSRLAASPTPEPSASAGATSSAAAEPGFNISPEECVRRLRAKGQPIRLFGEDDRARRLRVRALELLEERGTGRENEFRKTFEDMERAMEEKALGKIARAAHAGASAGTAGGAGPKEGDEAAGGKDEDDESGKREKRRAAEVGLIDLGLIKTDPNKLYPLVYYALKNLLREWEEWMDNRPDEIKRTTQGRMAGALQVQSAQNMKPLFKSLRQRVLPADVVRHLAEIFHHMHNRSYQKANDAYLRMSIGNAAWPIGVTSVGIHERSAREKIGQDVIAHVLNDEVSRKYIQAVKRQLRKYIQSCPHIQTTTSPDFAAYQTTPVAQLWPAGQWGSSVRGWMQIWRRVCQIWRKSGEEKPAGWVSKSE